ncbi:MAG: Uma2 family endonuclease [Rectinemataceae bacterium]|jgi:Uma2 family endonuclease
MNRMGDPNLAPQERFTYRHYRTWPDSERWEIIDGHAWAMSPAPKSRHQALVWKLSSLIYNFLKGKPCRAYPAPFDVLLPRGNEDDDEVDTIVQPDISVFCDKSKITERGARGAPDLVVEILSPSTSKKDLKDKFELYEKHGVREYWVIDPSAWSVWVYRLGSGDRFDEGELKERLGDTSPIASAVLEGFVVDPMELFADLD